MVIESVSRKTVVASSKETPCSFRLSSALRGSHSNSSVIRGLSGANQVELFRNSRLFPDPVSIAVKLFDVRCYEMSLGVVPWTTSNTVARIHSRLILGSYGTEI